MTLYSTPEDPVSHCVRIVMAEKDINAEVQYVDADNKPEDLNDLNPYDSILTLVDRELVLYDAQIMMEYLDERFPHPPLMPVDPVSRANNRQLRYRVMRDLFGLLDTCRTGSDGAANAARKEIRDNLTAIAPAFSQHPFFMSDDFSLVDCCLAPVLWRLESIAVKLPAQTRHLQQYAKRLFERPGFRASLSDVERGLHGR